MNKASGLILLILAVFGVSLIVSGLPIESNESTESSDYDFDNSTATNSTSNHTHKELYVIKAVVYEIGILADVDDSDNTTEDGPITHQQVDLTFYDAESNSSFINLGDVPLPQSVNVSGQILTGVAPVHIGVVENGNLADIISNLPITGTIVNITQTDTSFINIERHNVTEESLETKIEDKNDLAKLPILSEVLLPNNLNEAYDNVFQHQE